MKHSIQTSYFGGATEITLPDMPFPLEIDPRHETAPRGRTHMFSSPVTRAEQMARELWREAGV